jgi:hypothetical protein
MWKQIEGYPNYKVSDEGQVRNVKTNQLLKNYLGTDERYRVKLSDENYKRKDCHIHRLVATAFIPNIEGKPEVDHIDRNKLNNNVSNLRWVTRSENEYNKGYYHKSTKESQFISIQASGSFRVRIRYHYKIICCKTFKTKEEAILYRDQFMADNPR